MNGQCELWQIKLSDQEIAQIRKVANVLMTKLGDKELYELWCDLDSGSEPEENFTFDDLLQCKRCEELKSQLDFELGAQDAEEALKMLKQLGVDEDRMTMITNKLAGLK